MRRAAGVFLLGLVVGGENENSDGEPVGDTSLTPDPAVFVDASGPTVEGIPVTGSTVAGALVYCNDSDLDNATVTQPTTDDPIGWISRWGSATDCDVTLFAASVHRLGSYVAASGSWS